MLEDLDKIEEFYQGAKNKKVLIHQSSTFIANQKYNSGKLRLNNCSYNPFKENIVFKIEPTVHNSINLSQAKTMKKNDEILNSKVIKPFKDNSGEYYLYKISGSEIKALEKILMYKNLLDKEAYNEINSVLSKSLKDLEIVIDTIKLHQFKDSNIEANRGEIDQEEINNFKQHISNIH